jgi:hypothetical protein
MRVILDECLPRRLSLELIGHTVTTVPKAGFSGKLNGELLALIDGHYDAFITVDKNLSAQNKVAKLSLGVVVLRARSNKLADLKPLVPQILTTLATLKAGQVTFVGA